MTFEDQAGKTKLTIRIRFESGAIRDALLKIGMTQGWSQSLERLEAAGRDGLTYRVGRGSWYHVASGIMPAKRMRT